MAPALVDVSREHHGLAHAAWVHLSLAARVVASRSFKRLKFSSLPAPDLAAATLDNFRSSIRLTSAAWAFLIAFRPPNEDYRLVTP